MFKELFVEESIDKKIEKLEDELIDLTGEDIEQSLDNEKSIMSKKEYFEFLKDKIEEFKELFGESKMKSDNTLIEKSSEFKLILDNGDTITYYDNGKDWMRSYGDEKPIQAFDSKMWNKEKIIKRESKHYKIKKIVD